MVSALIAQKAFLNNFKNDLNQRVEIREDIKRYQETLNYASSKVDYSAGEHLYASFIHEPENQFWNYWV